VRETVARAAHPRRPVRHVSEDWSSPGELGSPVTVDGINVGLLICADAYNELPARQLRAAGAELLVSTAAWWPGQWGANGEWEARTVETGVPLIVCNRSGRGHESCMAESESVIVDRGTKLLTMSAPDSTVFVVDCEFVDGHISRCKLVASSSLPPGHCC